WITTSSRPRSSPGDNVVARSPEKPFLLQSPAPRFVGEARDAQFLSARLDLWFGAQQLRCNHPVGVGAQYFFLGFGPLSALKIGIPSIQRRVVTASGVRPNFVAT